MYVCLGALFFLSFLSCYVLLFSSLLYLLSLFLLCLSYITMSQYETQSVHKQDTIIYIQLLYNMACWLLYIMQDCIYFIE